MSKKILSDPVNRWFFSTAKKDAYFVGGYIRDLLRGNISLDKDFALKKNIKEIAGKCAEKFHGTLIEMKKHTTYRVVLKRGHSLDFSHLENSISEDLYRRDFTINAIAWSPEDGLIDPFNGAQDLKNQVIKAVNRRNLSEDPLRVLRAYRLAAQLGFNIEQDTRALLQKYAGGLKNVAEERVTEELIKLTMSRYYLFSYNLIINDNVLHEVVLLSDQNIRDNLVLLNDFDRFILKTKENNLVNTHIKKKIFRILRQNVSQGLSREGLIRLAILLYNEKKAKEKCYSHFRLSNSTVKKLQRLHEVIKCAQSRLTNNKLYDIFNIADSCEWEAALLVAVTRQRNVDKILKGADNFLYIKSNPLLTGYEIQSVIKSGPSAVIGRLQAEIQKRRFLGIIRKKSEARQWIISNLT